MPRNAIPLILGTVAALGLIAWLTLGGGLSGSSAGEEPDRTQAPGQKPGNPSPETGRGAETDPFREAIKDHYVRELLKRNDKEELFELGQTEEGVAALIRFLRESEDRELEVLVLYALGRSPFEAAQAEVVAAAHGKLGPDLRSCAILALAYSDPTIAHSVLGEIVRNEPDPALAGSAAQALVHISTHLGVDLLKEALLVADTPEKREQLYRAMAPDAGRPGRAGVQGRSFDQAMTERINRVSPTPR